MHEGEKSLINQRVHFSRTVQTYTRPTPNPASPCATRGFSCPAFAAASAHAWEARQSQAQRPALASQAIYNLSVGATLPLPPAATLGTLLLLAAAANLAGDAAPLLHGPTCCLLIASATAIISSTKSNSMAIRIHLWQDHRYGNRLTLLGSATRRKTMGAKAMPGKDVTLHGCCWFLGYVVQRKRAYRP